MALTTGQMAALALALRTETDAMVVSALVIRNDVFLTEWCNAASTVDAWHEACSGSELFEATDVSKFDNLSAGKRDAWRLMLDFAPVDFRKASNRKAVIDVWASTAGKPTDDAPAVLTKCLRKATHGELYLGFTTPAASDGVTAVRVAYSGLIGLTELSVALNQNP